MNQQRVFEIRKTVFICYKNTMIFFILDYSVTPGILTIYNLSNSFEQQKEHQVYKFSFPPEFRKLILQVLPLRTKCSNFSGWRTAGEEQRGYPYSPHLVVPTPASRNQRNYPSSFLEYEKINH